MSKRYQDIKDRLRSMYSSLHTTKAMKAEAAAKLRLTQARAMAGREYMDYIRNFTEELLNVQPKHFTIAPEMQALMRAERDIKTTGLLVLGADRGLAGNYNSLLEKQMETEYENCRKAEKEPLFLPAGKKAERFLRKKKWPLKKIRSLSDLPDAEEAKALNNYLIKCYSDGELDEIKILLHRFYSPGKQALGSVDYLPFRFEEAAGSSAEEAEDIRAKEARFTEFDPDYSTILQELFSFYLQAFIHQMMLESKGSEQIYRLRAMTQASDNAEDLIKELEIEFNRSRQEHITEEMIEIINAGQNEDSDGRERPDTL